MKKIANKLIEFGMGFEYEHNGSRGEILTSFELDVRIMISNGMVHFTHQGSLETHEEDERALDYLVYELDKIIIEETT